MSLKSRFSLWQKEEVYTHDYGTVSINSLIHTFLNDGILPFIQKNGYKFLMSKEYIENALATVLFHLDFDRFYRFKLPENVYIGSDIFNSYSDCLDWEMFWKVWNYSTNDFFNDAEVEIQILMWSCIDFDKSEACQPPLDESEIDDAYMNKLRSMDPYLLDQLNASNHYKFTRFDNS